MEKTLVEKYVAHPDNMRAFQQSRTTLEVTYLLERAMESKSIKRSQLAEMLGKSRGWVTQLLDGEKSHTLRTFTDVFAVLGHSLHFSVGSLKVDEIHGHDPGIECPMNRDNLNHKVAIQAGRQREKKANRKSGATKAATPVKRKSGSPQKR